MSRVFIATDPALGRRLVVKVLSPELAASVSVQRFKREIKVAASRQHANIVPLLSAGEVEGLPHYTMPYVDGVSLRERLRTGGPPSLPDTVSILRDVARAPAYATHTKAAFGMERMAPNAGSLTRAVTPDQGVANT